MRTVARAAALSAALAPLFQHHGPGGGEPDRPPTAGAATAKVPPGMMFRPGLPAQSPFVDSNRNTASRGDDPPASSAPASAPFAYSYNARTRTVEWVCERLGGGNRRDRDSNSQPLRYAGGPPGAAPPSCPSTAVVAVALRKRCRFREDGDV